jgi:hypothetical protein
MTESSTLSTRPASTKLRNNVPPPNNQISFAACARIGATVASETSATIVTFGCTSGRSVREKTNVFAPEPADPIAPATANVRRPMRKVSNSANSASKSMSGSMMIQSASPFGPAI